MAKTFIDILNIARQNVRQNPTVVNDDTIIVAKRYLSGLTAEVDEVEKEIKEDNSVFLTDELSDIAWNFAVVLALMEDRGLIEDAEEVINHGYQKYTERSPAFLETKKVLWNEIKQSQKAALTKKHQEKHGN